MSKYNDFENVLITNMQYYKPIDLNKVASYPLNGRDIPYGVTLEIHDDGTSQYAHKETEQYANPSGEQVYVVQTDTKDYIS